MSDDMRNYAPTTFESIWKGEQIFWLWTASRLIGSLREAHFSVAGVAMQIRDPFTRIDYFTFVLIGLSAMFRFYTVHIFDDDSDGTFAGRMLASDGGTAGRGLASDGGIAGRVLAAAPKGTSGGGGSTDRASGADSVWDGRWWAQMPIDLYAIVLVLLYYRILQFLRIYKVRPLEQLSILDLSSSRCRSTFRLRRVL
eukprot:263950-Prymnesium_polylepis.1